MALSCQIGRRRGREGRRNGCRRPRRYQGVGIRSLDALCCVNHLAPNFEEQILHVEFGCGDVVYQGSGERTIPLMVAVVGGRQILGRIGKDLPSGFFTRPSPRGISPPRTAFLFKSRSAKLSRQASRMAIRSPFARRNSPISVSKMFTLRAATVRSSAIVARSDWQERILHRRCSRLRKQQTGGCKPERGGDFARRLSANPHRASTVGRCGG
jgi:hypothetical protein